MIGVFEQKHQKILKHKKCKGIIQKVFTGKNEFQYRCIYCHKTVDKQNIYEV